MSERIKIAVCIPSGDDWKADFGLSLASMLQCNSLQMHPGASGATVQYEILNLRIANLAFSRNELARMALSRGADYILFIDADTRFPPFTACRLIGVAREMGMDIVATQTAGRVQHSVWRPGPGPGVQVAESLGTQCMLISAAVFRKVPEPWFLFEIVPGGKTVVGEDAYFTRKARAAGFMVAADNDLSKDVYHVGQFAYSTNEKADVASVRTVPGRNGNWAAPIRVIAL